MHNDLFSTTCPTCSTSRTLHIDSLPVVAAAGHICSGCQSDANRSTHGWTPENSLS